MNTTLPLPHLSFKHHLPFSIQDIIRLDGKGNYTVFSLLDGTQFLSSRSLGVYETIFPENFLRVHKGCIINLGYLDTLNDLNRVAILTDGSHVAVSRRRWAEIRSLVSD
ncbi:LytR/AlgR family response regulator transcription factor [Arundinibacter roseus]|uniref:LytTR family transcriptional regulator n=1 Tax=Arundinibacter roseus TaxID=2070510 RepID=A0A4R4JYM8_9BACT|nr:LytTR family DNA-binding domain-containing protein [Arundinibacter roseus]TDB59833.1 LytTR family transcriptional regulator [Arundinibacter roseus]